MPQLNTIRDEKVKAGLRSFHSRAFALTLKRIVLGSPVLIWAVLVLTLYMIVEKGIHNVKQLARNAANTVLERLIDPTLIDEEAALCAA
jgi:hypothetical protein